MSLRRGVSTVLAVTASLLLLALLAGKQVDPTARLRVHPLDLARPDAVLSTTIGVGPSELGYFAWTGSAPLRFRFGNLHAFDLVKVKLLSACGELSLDVLLDGAPVGAVRASGRWQELVVRLPRAGNVLQLARRSEEPCTIHFSRVKSTNAVGYSSSFPELYVLYDPRPYQRPSFPRTKVAEAVAAVVAACLGVVVLTYLLLPMGERKRLFSGVIGALVGVGVMAAFELVDLAGSLRIVYPSGSLWAFLLFPEALGLAYGARRLLRRWAVGAPLWLRATWTRWVGPQSALGAFLRSPVSTLRTRVAAVAAVGAYGALLIAFLPRTPFEWDEVLFLRALDRFDVAAHSPHPPGYPVFVAAERAVRLAEAAPVHAPQLASVAGSLIAVVCLALLLRRLGAPRFCSALGALLLAATPAFAFQANIGLSDALATGLGVAAAWRLIRFVERPSHHRDAALAAGLVAIATGTRPQVFLSLAGLVVWSLARSLRKGNRSPITFVVTGVLTGAASWAPAILATGWRRYWASVQQQRHWLDLHEGLAHLPGLSVGEAARAWLVRPFGPVAAAAVLWVLVAFGGWCWWRAGRRRLVVALALCGGGYLTLAPWLMAADTSVRYVLPALPFIAGLAAGVSMARWPAVRATATAALIALVVGMAWWVAPPLAQRAAEDAPVWAGLQWVRSHRDPQATTVVCDEVLGPHARYVLAAAGFSIVIRKGHDHSAAPGAYVEVLSPARPAPGNVLFASAWTGAKVRRLTRHRYLSCRVVDDAN